MGNIGRVSFGRAGGAMVASAAQERLHRKFEAVDKLLSARLDAGSLHLANSSEFMDKLQQAICADKEDWTRSAASVAKFGSASASFMAGIVSAFEGASVARVGQFFQQEAARGNIQMESDVVAPLMNDIRFALLVTL